VKKGALKNLATDGHSQPKHVNTESCGLIHYCKTKFHQPKFGAQKQADKMVQKWRPAKLAKVYYVQPSQKNCITNNVKGLFYRNAGHKAH